MLTDRIDEKITQRDCGQNDVERPFGQPRLTQATNLVLIMTRPFANYSGVQAVLVYRPFANYSGDLELLQLERAASQLLHMNLRKLAHHKSGREGGHASSSTCPSPCPLAYSVQTERAALPAPPHGPSRGLSCDVVEGARKVDPTECLAPRAMARRRHNTTQQQDHDGGRRRAPNTANRPNVRSQFGG